MKESFRMDEINSQLLLPFLSNQIIMQKFATSLVENHSADIFAAHPNKSGEPIPPKT